MATINMQTMRYLNLLDKTAHVKTTTCFEYNNNIIFAVQPRMVSKAIGQNSSNLKQLQTKIGKRIRIIKKPEDKSDAKKFIIEVITPTRCKEIQIQDNQVIITAGTKQNKASLIGRNHRRFDELKKILHNTFNYNLKII